jgi:hypothetical protein
MKEWSPVTDVSVANAIDYDSNSRTGKRCSYVGNEEYNSSTGQTRYRSLNVEELAIEEYACGKLPCIESPLQGGGWTGWHTEGVQVRVLFRILVSEPLLSYDYHNHEESYDVCQQSLEQMTIFLNPYQSSPLDLHVGHCLLETSTVNIPIRSFYERRRGEIEQFLKTISSLPSQDLSDLVYQSILKRKQTMIELGKQWKRDVQLLHDMKEVRTLSLLAAGFGGKLLAAMFRCLCYDYRQYGGGLPDLTLVRATINNNNIDNKIDETNNVDWSEWIGEGFTKDRSSRGKSILLDRDDEFLGGSLDDKKTSSSSKKEERQNFLADDDHFPDPHKLLLSYDGKPVILEAMLVEVKSASDTLDARQEDWLNIIGSHGEARVCKFESSKKKKS